MGVHFGRLIGDGIPLAIVIFFNFGLFDLKKFSFIETGIINFKFLSSIILLIIACVFLLFDNFVLGGPWSGLVFGILATLILQNWILGLAIGILNFILTTALKFLAPE